MIKTQVAAGLLALAVTASLGAQSVETTGEIKTASFRDRSNLPPVRTQAVSQALSRTAPQGLSAPEGCTDAWFATLSVGGKELPVVVGRRATGTDAAAKGLPNTVYVDCNADGKLDANEALPIAIQTQTQRGRTITSGQKRGIDFTIGGATLKADFTFSQMGTRPPSVNLQFPQYLHATTELDGEKMVVGIVDSNFNGKFGDPDDLWTIAKPGGNPASPYALHAVKEGHFAGGKLTRIAVDGNKIKLTSATAKGPDPMELAAHRHRVEKIWFERFDAERANFVKQRKLDTSRPKAATPIAWKTMTFDEGIALSKKTGKPLFVDVMAFWCVWCYRLDYYTYPDQQVAALLNDQFIPVKIIQEQDPAGDYERVRKLIGARGIPAMGIFAGDGKPIHTISGWKKPEDFVKELQKASPGKASKGK